jgi:hypothetical protein
MPKVLYDYVLFDQEDIMQLPLRYATMKELCIMFGMTNNALNKRFNKCSVIYINGYGIERFKKESE